MKTLKEFIQRLQDDAAFEKKAQAFDHSDELMAFVKREGYDFTLEELMREFKRPGELSTKAGGMAPAPTDSGASTRRMPEEAEDAGTPEAFPHSKKRTALPESRSLDVTRQQPLAGLQKPPGETPSPGPQEKSPGELPRFGGGRHRGFSPQRLKSIPGEEP